MTISQISKAQCEAMIKDIERNSKMATIKYGTEIRLQTDFYVEFLRSSHVAIINSLADWVKNKENDYSKLDFVAKGEQVFREFINKENLLTYLEEELENIKNV